ncbi:hypothetical protein ABZ705_19240 [Streptomyces sp. NPDC006984]|uniref:hypothetical protein n=1 Tax=Streptomyces sp. NPDC006984 TaxID=3155463 RepID=UPI0033D86CDC
MAVAGSAPAYPIAARPAVLIATVGLAAPAPRHRPARPAATRAVPHPHEGGREGRHRSGEALATDF